MKYVEPTILVTYRADSAIQSLAKSSGQQDGMGLPTNNAAYRADE